MRSIRYPFMTTKMEVLYGPRLMTKNQGDVGGSDSVVVEGDRLDVLGQ